MNALCTGCSVFLPPEYISPSGLCTECYNAKAQEELKKVNKGLEILMRDEQEDTPEDRNKPLNDKLRQIVDDACADADTYGEKTIHTCNMLGYGWDRDVWNHRGVIIKTIKNRGYSVNVSVNYEVTDISITPIITIEEEIK